LRGSYNIIMFDWLKEQHKNSVYKDIHKNVLEEFEQELRESAVDMKFENFAFFDNNLAAANSLYVSRICDENPAAFYIFTNVNMKEYELQEFIEEIDTKSRFVAVEIDGALFVTRKSMWKKMQNGYNLY